MQRILKKTLRVDKSAEEHGGIKSICVYRPNARTVQIYIHKRTHTHTQHVNPWLYFSSLFEVVSQGRL